MYINTTPHWRRWASIDFLKLNYYRNNISTSKISLSTKIFYNLYHTEVEWGIYTLLDKVITVSCYGVFTYLRQQGCISLQNVSHFFCSNIFCSNSLHLCDAYMHLWTESLIVQIMAWSLFSAKPLPEPMQIYPLGAKFGQFTSKETFFLSQNVFENVACKISTTLLSMFHNSSRPSDA